MANQKGILAAELFVDDSKAAATLAAFLNTLELTETQINRVGRDSRFGRDIASQLDEVDARAKKTSGILSDAFSPENIVKGAAFGFIAKVLGDSVKSALDADKANRLLASSATEAGKSYAALADENERFAAAAGLAETKAAGTLAKIQQLSTFSGGKTSTEALTKSFLDLGAAKGIASGELETLIGSILSGQDEGLNRLGIADPGKLYAAYAEQVGKSTDSLTQFEKVQAAVNAVQDKAAIFTGANADKMASLTGQYERSQAQLENLETDLGTNITQSLEFRDAVNFLTSALGGLSLATADVQKKLAQGLTPKQIAEESADSTTSQILDFAKNTSGLVLGRILYEYDVLTEGVDVANKRFEESSTGARKRRIEALTANIEGEQKLAVKQEKAALDEKAATQARADAQAEKDHKAELAKIRERAIERAIATNAPLADIRKLQTGLNKKELGETDFNQQNDKINDYLEKQVKAGKDKVAELIKAAVGAFDGIFEGYAKLTDNPFVAVFEASSKSIDKLRENISGLRPEIQASLVELVERLNEVDLAKARLDNALNAQSLRQAARDFRDPLTSDAQNKAQTEKFTREFLAANPNYLFLQQSEFDQANFSGSRKFEGKSLEQVIQADLEKRAGLGIETADERRAKDLAERIKTINASRVSGDDVINGLADRKLIAISNGLDPNKLDDKQRAEFAAAREREATRLDQAETKAREIEAKKAEALGDIRNDVGRLAAIAESEGLGGVVRIIDESKSAAKVETKKPTAKDTEAKYKQNFGTFGGGRGLTSF